MWREAVLCSHLKQVQNLDRRLQPFSCNEVNAARYDDIVFFLLDDYLVCKLLLSAPISLDPIWAIIERRVLSCVEFGNIKPKLISLIYKLILDF